MKTQPSDEELQAAFRSLADLAPHESVDADRIWDALSGELSPAERRTLVEQLARDPASAEAWRAASELWREARGTEPAVHVERRRLRAWTWPVLAAAAAALLALVLPLPWRDSPSPSPVLREAETAPVKALVPEGASLPRGAFRLAWEPVAPDARHVVRVITEDLALTFVARDVRGGEYVVPAERLAGLAAGTRVLWTVEGRRADGTVVSSGTFVARLVD